ncbi:hypothetical protein J5N97_027692 [Dioscorea zingiberensis]|uniref:Cyclin-like domain-containing protein n=1 Tax=Dioscorea zingiberensis TaxID=325984 RepID=A0A9D5BXL0_9LILI|nr:hypothetical protein J5N97_027692 [Dioscorea zingiberensis]
MTKSLEIPDCYYPKESVLVCPKNTTPRHTLYLSNLDDQKFLRFTIKYLHLYKKSVCAEDLKDSLSKVLVEYYPLAGRLKPSEEHEEKFELDCNGEGVYFAEAHADLTVDEFLQASSKPNRSWRKLLFRLDSQTFLDVPPLVIQVTYLSCGGMILCTAINHCFCDGIGSSQFLHAWSQLTCKPNAELLVTPFHGRHLLRPRVPPQISFSHPEFHCHEPSFDLTQFILSQPVVPVSVTFTPSQILSLKKLCVPSLKCTSFEVLASHVWRSWVKALDLAPFLTVKLLFSINVRKKMRPKLPIGYYGNGFVLGCAETSVDRLVVPNLQYGVKLVQQAKDCVTNDYVRSMVDFLEERKVKPDLSSSLVISQWSKQGLEDLDFGEGRPLHMGPLASEIYCLFLPVVGDIHAFTVLMSVPQSLANKFQHFLENFDERKMKEDDGFIRHLLHSLSCSESAIPTVCQIHVAVTFIFCGQKQPISFVTEEVPIVTGKNLSSVWKSYLGCTPKMAGGWCFSRAEIEHNSPSRRDGIDLKKESELRQSYCSLIQDLGMRLGAPQLTIATAMVFCHRFYIYQSHAKNDWRTISTACLFHAAKVEDTPISVNKVVAAAYEMIYRKDPDAPQRIRQKDVFDKQKALVLIGERMLLSNIGFDFNIQHPYRPLVRALNKFGITEKDVRQVAWNYVNDWLKTTLCLQYKPHYIAAGSLFIAAKIHNVKLPSGKDYVWWNEFDVAPKQLNAVVQEMTELLGYKRKGMQTCTSEKPAEISSAKKKDDSSSPESCVLSRPVSLSRNSSNGSDGQLEMINQNHPSSCNPADEQACLAAEVKTEVQPRVPDGSESVADGEASGKGMNNANSEPDQVVNEPRNLDMDKILAMRKKRKTERENEKRALAMKGIDEDDWIEKELERGIVFSAQSVVKKQRLADAFVKAAVSQ